MTSAIESILACPACQKPIERTRSSVRCASCHATYARSATGILDLTPSTGLTQVMANTKISLSLPARIKDHLRRWGLFKGLKIIFWIFLFPIYIFRKLVDYSTNKAYRELYSDPAIMKEHLDRLFMGQILDPQLPLLEISCATGKNILMLKNMGYQALGIDIEPRDAYWSQAPERFFRANAYRLPFQSGSLRYVLSYASLEHLQEHERALAEIHRVLAANGTLFLMVPQYTLYNRLWNRCKDPDHYREYKVDELQTLLQSAGFRVSRLETKWFYTPVFVVFFNELLCTLGSLVAGQRGVWKLMDFLERWVPSSERGHIYALVTKK